MRLSRHRIARPGRPRILRRAVCRVIEDGDVIGLAEAVETFVAAYDDRRAELDRIAAEGSRWILSEYSAEHQSADSSRRSTTSACDADQCAAVARSGPVSWSGSFLARAGSGDSGLDGASVR